LVYDIKEEETQAVIGIFDLKEKKEYKLTLYCKKGDNITKVCVNNKEDKLAVTFFRADYSDGFTDTVDICDIKKGKLDKKMPVKYLESFSYVSFSTDDKKLYLTTWRSGITLLYDISNGKLLEETTDDFKHLFMINKQEGEIRTDWVEKIFKISKEVYNKINAQGVVTKYFISPSRTKVAVYYENLSLKVFSLSDGKELVKIIRVLDSCRISFNEKEDGLRIMFPDKFGVLSEDFPFLSTEEIIELGKKQTKD
jgi:hypothetical protein